MEAQQAPFQTFQLSMESSERGESIGNPRKLPTRDLTAGEQHFRNQKLEFPATQDFLTKRKVRAWETIFQRLAKHLIGG